MEAGDQPPWPPTDEARAISCQQEVSNSQPTLQLLGLGIEEWIDQWKVRHEYFHASSY